MEIYIVLQIQLKVSGKTLEIFFYKLRENVFKISKARKDLGEIFCKNTWLLKSFETYFLKTFMAISDFFKSTSTRALRENIFKNSRLRKSLENILFKESSFNKNP